MKRILIPITLAVLLAGTGAVFWSLGTAEERLAQLQTSVATLDYSPVVDDEDEVGGPVAYAARVPGVGEPLVTGARKGRATAEYWLARYDALTLERDAGGAPLETDPVILLLAANAAYRTARAAALDRNTALERLDGVVKNYGDVLRSSADTAILEDAAYNYEFTWRIRTVLERARSGSLAAADADAAPPTIHGHPGGPPETVDMNQFKIVVPKRSDERDNNPEGGQGQERVRKG